MQVMLLLFLTLSYEFVQLELLICVTWCELDIFKDEL